ncbi:MAG TPA: hypothetical protein VME42_01380 [Steroidobacteraceae bacterium]|nr:hypothetical protein [Steroidobacteraceae bacterium]
MVETDAGAARAAGELPPDLEARIAMLEASAAPGDFDRRSWFWMVLFGVVAPALLLIYVYRA